AREATGTQRTRASVARAALACARPGDEQGGEALLDAPADRGADPAPQGDVSPPTLRRKRSSARSPELPRHVEDVQRVTQRIAFRPAVVPVEDVELVVDQLHRSAIPDTERGQGERPPRDERLRPPVHDGE